MTARLRAIKAGDKLTGLSLGHEKFVALKTFVQRNALTYEQKKLARTYAVFDETKPAKAPKTWAPKLLAYLTLVCGEVTIKDGDNNLVAEQGVDFNYKQYPAVKVARLAVDTSMRGKDIGSDLISFALAVVLDHICPHVGCRFLMVDAKKDSVGFTRKSASRCSTRPTIAHAKSP
jgi:GNAT superfamily N-acetyltransferase